MQRPGSFSTRLGKLLAGHLFALLGDLLSRSNSSGASQNQITQYLHNSKSKSVKVQENGFQLPRIVNLVFPSRLLESVQRFPRMCVPSLEWTGALP